jgi:4-amino-4-deoxy-L-arabinose transferase-like glycosyltransferase
MSINAAPQSTCAPVPALPKQGRVGDVFLIFAVLLYLCVQILLIQLPYIESDEAAFGACAARQLSLSLLPFTQCVDIKPPGIFALYELIYAIFGAYSGLGLRLSATFTGLVCAATLYRLTRLASRDAIAKAATAIFLLFTASSHFLLALKTELIAIIFVQLALVLLFEFKVRAQVVKIVAAGVCLALAVLFKQPAALFSVPLCLFLLVGSRSRVALGAGVKHCLILGLSCLATLSLVALIYWLQGHFEDFAQQIWSRPILYTANGSEASDAGRHLRSALSDLRLPVILMILLSFSAVIAAVVDRRPNLLAPFKAVGWWLVPWILCAAIIVSLGGRFFPSYFMFILPFLCIILGILVQPLLDLIAGSKLRELTFITLCGLTAIIGLRSTYNLKVLLEGGLSDSGTVLAYAQPGDTLYVWGYTPEFYASTKMIPASRFVITSLLVGHFFESGDNRPPERQIKFVRPGDWDIFLTDLAQAKTFLFIDANRVRMGKPGNFAPQRYPRMKQFLDTYCSLKTNIGPMPLYRCVVPTQ